MLIRPYAPRDYLTLFPWWNGYAFPPPPPEFLPDVGRVVGRGETLLCAGFLYQTNSPIAWLEWVVGDPEADKRERGEALDILLTGLIESAKEMGAKVIFTGTVLDPLVARYERHGFLRTDTNVTHLIRRL